MADYQMIAFGAARTDIFTKLPDEKVEGMCKIDRHRCVIELEWGAKIPLVGIEYWVGGNAANLAVGMKRLGLGSLLIAELGNGAMADIAYTQLADEKIAMDFVTRTEGVAPGLGVVVNYQEERTILSYYSPSRPVFPQHLPKTEWAYLTSMGEGFEDYFFRALSWAKNNRVKIGFNPGGRQIKKGSEWLGPFLRASEVLLVNREEAMGIIKGGTVAKADVGIADIRGILSHLSELGPKIVVVTDGPSGAYVFNGQRMLHAGIIHVPVVERTGAGDAFSTGFLSALIEGEDVETAMRWGMVESAGVIGKVGPQAGLVRKDELAEWMEKAKEVEIKGI